jgi:transposase
MHSKEVIEMVKKFYKKDKSLRKVAKRLSMSVSSVSFIINNNYDKVKKKRGPKFLINERKTTLIKKEVRRLNDLNEQVTANKIKSACDLDVHLKTIQRKLFFLNFNYGNIPKKLPLTKKHKEERMKYADTCIKDLKFIFKTVFSDEKRFCLDGPDNWCSWYDPFDPPLRIKRAMKGGGIMVWGMVFPDGHIFVTRLDGRVDSTKYCSMLNEEVKPLLISHFGSNEFFLQQDNCKIHVSKYTLSWLKTNKIQTFEWPSMSPDLNIQENVWQTISNMLYDGKQFENNDQLWSAIKKTVDEINSSKKEEIRKKFDKYGERLLLVKEKKGDEIRF